MITEFQINILKLSENAKDVPSSVDTTIKLDMDWLQLGKYKIKAT